jgi:two-component system CheB/CheR fusion protein
MNIHERRWDIISEKETQPRGHYPIVALGASAGGLEPLQKFFSAVPPDCGIAFVVITHTHPDRESILPGLLSQVTSMEVISAEDEERALPNRVLVARDSLLTLEGGVLKHVKYDSKAEAMHHPIDHFFRELAEDQGEAAVGIILSGSGSDGSIGVKAVKAAGGTVMVQDPSTAQYPSMPESAQSTGIVDFVRSPKELAETLLNFCSRVITPATQPEGEVGLPDETVHSILVRLKAHSGQDFTCYKKNTMARRIQRRMAVNRIESPREYLGFIRENPSELESLLLELLISVTSFFRDPEAFQALAEKALPSLLKERDDGHTLRVWIPGCATGEEAYSIAILLDEVIRKEDRMHEVQIFATDLDRNAIEVARNGLYPDGISMDVSQERRQRYFTQEDGYSYRVHKNIRDMIVFAVQNLISDPPFTRMDLIVCRNLLIYLNAEAQRRVLPIFHYSLRNQGILFLGSSETVTGAEEMFETVDSKNKIMRRRTTAVPVHPPITTPDRSHRGETEEGIKSLRTDRSFSHLTKTIEHYLLNKFVPCSVFVDERDTVLHFHGELGLYFQPEQGQPKNRVLEMAREGLRLPLSEAMRKARETGKEVIKKKVPVKTNGEYTEVEIRVRSFERTDPLHGLLLVSIHPHPTSTTKVVALESVPLNLTNQSSLERELQYTRENLQSTIEELETSNEELKSSNEELQSTNEELQSSNEELETSREEIQSLNEELNTVNSELKSKLDDLSRSNDDMSNLLNSMQVATIFLDTGLRVKRYTKKAQDLVRLIESDIGRPLSDITSKMQYKDLTKDCQEVLETLIPQEKEIVTDEGHFFLVRLLPYRTSENVIDGVVVTILDIDRIKTMESHASAMEVFESIVQTVRQPLVVLDNKLRVVKCNNSFSMTFQTNASETEGKLVYELGNGQWDIPELRHLLEEILPNRTLMTDFRVHHSFPDIGSQTFLLNARQLKAAMKPNPELIFLSFERVLEEAS